MREFFIKPLIFFLIISSINLFFGNFILADSSFSSVEVIPASDEQEIDSGTISEIIIDPDKPNIILSGTSGYTGALSNITIPSIVADETEVVLNLSLIIIQVDGKSQITVNNELTASRNSAISENNFELTIPAGTIIQDTDGGWNGRLILPSAKNNDSVSLLEVAGQENNVEKVVEVGFLSGRLIFDKAVRLKLSNQAGKNISYSIGSGSFVEINNVCENDINPAVADNGECKISVGSDLIIWTKHFTKFVAFSSLVLAETGGGGFVPQNFKGKFDFVINGGSGSTASRIVNLTFDTDIKDIKNMAISNFSDFQSASQEPYKTTKEWTLTPSGGKKNIYVKLYNQFSVASEVVSKSVVLIIPVSVDINNDKKIDIFDFNLLMIYWNSTDKENPADFNKDEIVDIFDFNFLMVNWGGIGL